MNRVITINLNGNAYQLEESGYEALRVYLDNAARRLEGNPDRDEIIADIEQAIADKFRAVLGPNKTVVITREVESVLIEMGPVQDASSNESQSGKTASSGLGATGEQRGDEAKDEAPGAVKRLYRIYDGAMIRGVCTGLAAYFNLDVTLFRILFIILTCIGGTGVLIYGIMVLIVPSAKTPEEKAAASGAAATAQEFIRRAKAGYYEGMKTFQNKHARREWKRKFKQEMRGWNENFQRQMQRNAYRDQGQWNWTHQHPNAAIVRPAVWLINAVIAIVAVFALFSLVTAGTVFGISLPVGIPLWVGIVAVIVVWHLAAWPFKAMQWGSCHEGYGHCGHGPFGAIWGFLVGLGFLMLLVWLGDHYVPEFHDALKHLPPLFHQAVDSFQHWLDRH